MSIVLGYPTLLLLAFTVLGEIGLVLIAVVLLAAFSVAIVAIVLAALNRKSGGLATTGLVTGILTVILVPGGTGSIFLLL